MLISLLSQVVNALESNPTARRTQLQHKFEQVIALVEDNIYECSSEAWAAVNQIPEIWANQKPALVPPNQWNTFHVPVENEMWPYLSLDNYK